MRNEIDKKAIPQRKEKNNIYFLKVLKENTTRRSWIHPDRRRFAHHGLQERSGPEGEGDTQKRERRDGNMRLT